MRGKRQAIVETAERLWLRDGIRAHGMEMIADAVPVSKMTIYNHFKSKQRLLNEVVDRLLNDAVQDLRQMIDAGPDPLSVLQQIVNYNGMDHVSEAFVKDLLQDYPAIAMRLLDYQKTHLAPELEALFFKAQQLGQIRKELSPHVLVLFMMSLKEFFTKPEVIAGMTDMKALSDQMMTLLYYGMIADDYKPKS